MKGSWMSSTSSTSPPHLVVTTGYTQTLQCRKGLQSAHRFTAPFFLFVSSVPPWPFPGASEHPSLPLLLKALFLTCFTSPLIARQCSALLTVTFPEVLLLCLQGLAILCGVPTLVSVTRKPAA